MKALSGEYQRAVVVINPKSTRAKQIGREIDGLEWRLPITKIESSREAKVTRDKLYKEAEAGDIIFSAGGDGLTNQIGNIIMRSAGDGQSLLGLPFVPLRGGYANDVAVMLNGRHRAARILEAGEKLQAQPLEISTYEPDGIMQKRWAFGHFGVGGTGLASQRIEEVKASSNRFTRWAPIALGRKAVASWVALEHQPEFKLTSNGQAQAARDVTFPRGNVMAKFGHPHANLKVPEFEALISSPNNLGAALVDMIKMQRGRLCGEMVAAMSFSFETADNRPIFVHYDGEPELLESGSIIDAYISSNSYTTLTTV